MIQVRTEGIEVARGGILLTYSWQRKMFTLHLADGTFLAEYDNGTDWFAWRFTRENVTGILREIAWQAAQKDSPLDVLAAAGVMKVIREVTQ